MWFVSLLLMPTFAHVIGDPQNLTSPCTDKNHLFLAPGVLSAGGVNRACISRFYPEGPARMVLTLLADDGESVTAARDLPPGDGGCLDITAPMRPNTKADLIVNMRYKEAACVWERRMTVRVASGRVVTLITERARYRPGDTIKVRAIVLKADLTPAQGNIDEIWLEGPHGAWDGVRVAQWSGVRTRLGLAQIQHQLDEHAPPGKWTIRASLADGSQGAVAFHVGNYELPPFQLSVRHAPRVLRTSERLVWTVCVRYPWSEAVEGMLVIRLRGAGGSGGGEGSAGVRTAVRLRAPRACHRHAAAAHRVGLAAEHPPQIVIADFSFQEEGTRIWQNTTVVSEVVENPVTLEFLTRHRAILSPSLPYKLKVKATRWDEKAAVGERVRVCRSAITDKIAEAIGADGMRPNLGVAHMDMKMGADFNLANTVDGSVTCVSAITDNRGVARLTFPADRTVSALYQFQASLNNVTASLVLSAREGASSAALGPIRPEANASRTLVPLYLELEPVKPITVHFVVITRGGIIYRWGATTQCPSSSSQLQPAPRNSSCPPLQRLPSEERPPPRVLLPLKLSHQMCPDGHLVAFFRSGDQLVSAYKHFEMEDCFANKAEAHWLSRQSSPGGVASLIISTGAPSLCALSALDAASSWDQPAAPISQLLLTALRGLLYFRRNLTESDAAGDCFLAKEPPSPAASGAQLTAEWLAGAGVRVLPLPRATRCPPPPAPLRDAEVQAPRTDFSEAWLWRLVAVGLNGSATTTARAPDSITRYEASVLCLSRTGLAIAPPAVLQVFREFFIHADGPKRLRKGDNSIVRYRIFNYLYEPLGVQIEVSGNSVLEVRSVGTNASVAARSSVAGRVELSAKAAGVARLRVRATSVADVTRSATNTVARDEVIIEIEIEPEGLLTQEFKSTMLCSSVSEPVPSRVFWSWPSKAMVDGTEVVTVWAAGDAIGPLLADADALVTMPRGCGEQNMARLATNLLALRLLDPKTPAAATALRHAHRGFARQLQYSHPSGGFSAFGPADGVPSTWLTAFCLRYMRTAYQLISPGTKTPPAIERAERWLLSQQMENGCFRNEGQVFHRELKGGLNEDGEIASVALTAYVITSLVEGSANLPLRVITNSLSCLRALPLKKSKSHTGVYANALLTYAFTRLRRYEDELRRSNEAYLRDGRDGPGLREDEDVRQLVLFMKLAKRNRDYVYWESGSLASSIEATAYGVLSLAQCTGSLRASCTADARAATRWLAAHRGPSGGFVATQDTLVAMEALSSWLPLQQNPPTKLMVFATNKGRTETITIHPGSKIPDVLKVAGGDLTISVQGTGCAFVQATRSYRTTDNQRDEGKSLTVQVSVKTEGPFDCENGTACFCAAVVEACVVWTGSFPEMALLEITLPGGFGADAGLLYSQLREKNTLLRRIEMSARGKQAALYLSHVEGESAAHRCFKVHAVGPQAHTRPAHVKLYDYYRPTIKSVQMYTIPEDCPASISHTSDSYLSKENLFSKAKSETGEILISEEFSFEDIPEGTPLEDPLYENLTKKNDTNNMDIYNIANDKTFDEIANYVKEINNKEASSRKIHHKEASGREIDNKVTESRENNIKEVKEKENRSLNDKETPRKAKAERNYLISSENAILSRHFAEMKETNHKFLELQTDETKELGKLRENLTKEGLQQKPEEKIERIENNFNEEIKPEVDNPSLSNFHVIDTEKDLEFPTGVEGPIPSVVLPPKDFVFTPMKVDTSKSLIKEAEPFLIQAQNYEHIIRHRRKLNYSHG